MSWIDLMVKVLGAYKQSSGWENPLYFAELSNLTNRQARTLSKLIKEFASCVSALNKCQHSKFKQNNELNERVCDDCGAICYGNREYEERDELESMSFSQIPNPVVWGRWE